MYRLVVVLLVATAVNAGNLAIGLNSVGYGSYGRVLNSGSTVSQQATSTSISNAAVAPVALPASPAISVAASPAISVAAAPVSYLAAAPLAVAAAPVVSVPTATSSQSRIDVINSSPLVSQVVSSVPVNFAVNGAVGAGYGYGYGNSLVANAGLVTGSVNAAYGSNGYGHRSY